METKLGNAVYRMNHDKLKQYCEQTLHVDYTEDAQEFFEVLYGYLMKGYNAALNGQRLSEACWFVEVSQ